MDPQRNLKLYLGARGGRTGWNASVSREYKQKKLELPDKLERNVRYVEEIYGLDGFEIEQRSEWRSQMHNIMKEDDLKWMQRAKDKDLQLREGNKK
jgi:cellulose biosynthesis protein BcsQ